MKFLRNWFRRGRMESDLNRELEYHLSRKVADLVSSGMSELDARRQANLELGGITQVREEVRDIWLTRWLRDFVYDLRFSVRSLLRNPVFTATVILSLAMGIGVTTAVYSLVDQVILRKLPVPDPDRLVLIDWKGEQASAGRGSTNLMSYPMCRDLEQQKQFFLSVMCRHFTDASVTFGAESDSTVIEVTSSSYFSTLDVKPHLGRVFTAEDDGAPGANQVVVLSYDFWRTRMGASPDIIGTKVSVNKNPMTVIGVAAPTFRGVDIGLVPALWLPASMVTQAIPGWEPLRDRRARWMQIIARLQDGVTSERAQAGLQPWFKSILHEDIRRSDFPNLAADRRASFLGSTLVLTSGSQGHSAFREIITTPLWVLLSGTALLLGLACLNVAGLFLARSSARQRENTTRLALGASRDRIGRQLLADSLSFAVLGGVLGCLLAPVLMRLFIAFVPESGAGTGLDPGIDANALLATVSISILAGILSGMGPAIQAGREGLIASLRDRQGTGGGVRLRRVLVTCQIALTLVLLIGAMLFLESLNRLRAKGPGYSTENLISFGIDPRKSGYTPEASSRLTRQLQDLVQALPVTQSVGRASFELLDGGSWNNFITVQGATRFTTEGIVDLNSVTPDFLTTLGARIVAGRGIDVHDAAPSDPGTTRRRVALINEHFVRKYFNGANPVGARIAIGRDPSVQPQIEIVGVVSTFAYRGVRQDAAQAFLPATEGSSAPGNYYVRIRGNSQAAYDAIRAGVRSLDPGLPIEYMRTVEDKLNLSLSAERLMATLSIGFGLAALALSLIGLYGVMSFVVTQRTREIGVRLALGATRGSAIWLVLGDASRMLILGALLAIPGIWGLGRLVQSQLYGVSPADPFAITVASVLLVGTGVAAAWIPAWRASRIDPIEALRFE